jgi:hypothetical protein
MCGCGADRQTSGFGSARREHAGGTDPTTPSDTDHPKLREDVGRVVVLVVVVLVVLVHERLQQVPEPAECELTDTPVYGPLN